MAIRAGHWAGFREFLLRPSEFPPKRESKLGHLGGRRGTEKLYGSRLDQVGTKHQVSSKCIASCLDSQLPMHRHFGVELTCRPAPADAWCLLEAIQSAVAHTQIVRMRLKFRAAGHGTRLECKPQRHLEDLCVHQYRQGRPRWNGTRERQNITGRMLVRRELCTAGEWR